PGPNAPGAVPMPATTPRACSPRPGFRRAPRGCWKNRFPCATGIRASLPAPSAWKAAGGTATTPVATITSSRPRRDSAPGPSPRWASREAGCCTAGSREPPRSAHASPWERPWPRRRCCRNRGHGRAHKGQDGSPMSAGGLPHGVAPDTPGAHVPRIVSMRARLRGAANEDLQVDAPAYAELHCLSDFTFLRGAASAEELFERAARCGYEALAITDECSLAGIVRARDAAKITGLHLVVGAEFRLEDGLRLVLLVEDRTGYSQLCRLITVARRAAVKGEYRLGRVDV